LQVAFERVHAHFAAAVAELDLAPVQAKALHELDVDPPISMRELAERLKSDPSNVTGLIDRLEARGLVERRADPNDRRIKGLALTPAGAANPTLTIVALALRQAEYISREMKARKI